MKLIHHLIMNNRCYKIPRCSVSFRARCVHSALILVLILLMVPLNTVVFEDNEIA